MDPCHVRILIPDPGSGCAANAQPFRMYEHGLRRPFVFAHHRVAGRAQVGGGLRYDSLSGSDRECMLSQLA